MFIDSHAHFDLLLENNTISEDEVVNDLATNSIAFSVQVAIDTPGFEWARNFSKKHKDRGVLYAIGIHPSSHAPEMALKKQSDFIDNSLQGPDKKLLFGVGECGLDYFRMRQPEEMQKQSFEYQIDLAARHDLPVIVHSRDAMEDTITILKKKSPPKGIMHCFPGSPADAKRLLDLGFYLSFAGNVTYKKAEVLHQSAQYVPLDRLLVETDAPFLTPVPHRGKKNRPHYVKHTYEFIAELRKEPLSTIKEAVWENFNRIRNL